jgi:hypothetical protein
MNPKQIVILGLAVFIARSVSAQTVRPQEVQIPTPSTQQGETYPPPVGTDPSSTEVCRVPAYTNGRGCECPTKHGTVTFNSTDPIDSCWRNGPYVTFKME